LRFYVKRSTNFGLLAMDASWCDLASGPWGGALFQENDVKGKQKSKMSSCYVTEPFHDSSALSIAIGYH